MPDIIRDRVALSIEKEAFAHETFRFRSFLRQFDSALPDAYTQKGENVAVLRA